MVQSTPLVAVKVCVYKVDVTSTAVAGTCHLEQSTLLVAVKVCVHTLDGTSTTVAVTCHTVGISTIVTDISHMVQTTHEQQQVSTN